MNVFLPPWGELWGFWEFSRTSIKEFCFEFETPLLLRNISPNGEKNSVF